MLAYESKKKNGKYVMGLLRKPNIRINGPLTLGFLEVNTPETSNKKQEEGVYIIWAL